MQIKIEKKVFWDGEDQIWRGELILKVPCTPIPEEYWDKDTCIFGFPLDENFPSEANRKFRDESKDAVLLQMEEAIEYISKTLETVKAKNLDKRKNRVLEETIILEV